MKLATITKMDFTFSNLMHSALVSVICDDEKTFVHIQLINSFLRKVFGLEHIRFYNYRGEIKLKDVEHPFVYQIAKLVSLKVNEKMNPRVSHPLRIV